MDPTVEAQSLSIFYMPQAIYSFFSICETLKLFPRKIRRGLMWGSPSAKIFNWTVHCLLSRSDCAPQCQSVFAPVWSYPWPLLMVNGRGVWSAFAIVDKLDLPSGPSVASDTVTRRISRWNLWIFSSWSIGCCWAMFVAQQYKITSKPKSFYICQNRIYQ